MPLKRNYRKSTAIYRKRENQRLQQVISEVSDRKVKRVQSYTSANYKYLALIQNSDGSLKITDFPDKLSYLDTQKNLNILRAYKYHTSNQRQKIMIKMQKYQR